LLLGGTHAPFFHRFLLLPRLPIIPLQTMDISLLEERKVRLVSY
jgi:hypothetical protein